ncbi:MAG: DUF523 domain-containing protein [Nitrospirota bacterium]
MRPLTLTGVEPEPEPAPAPCHTPLPGAPILVSACLVGLPCRYDGSSRPLPGYLAHTVAGELIPVCPEMLGGLSSPRCPAQIQSGDGYQVVAGGSRVIDRAGSDVTDAFLDGAHATLRIAQEAGVTQAILKERSPSCGSCRLHRRGTLVSGVGVTTALLRMHGIRVLSEAQGFAGLQARAA